MATPVTAAPATLRVTIELDLADMLSVGHSLRARARKSDMPEGTRTIYSRVGDEMVKAAQAAIAKGTKP